MDITIMMVIMLPIEREVKMPMVEMQELIGIENTPMQSLLEHQT